MKNLLTDYNERNTYAIVDLDENIIETFRLKTTALNSLRPLEIKLDKKLEIKKIKYYNRRNTHRK